MNSPTPLEWTEEKVEKFWSLVAKTELTKLSFSRFMSSELTNFVSNFANESSRILDFGAGDGDLAVALLDAGFKVAVYEPSSERRATISKKIPSAHPGFLGIVDQNSEETFDIICVFEVLEHILPDSVDAVLFKLTKLLAPGGVLLGTVPLEEDLLQQTVVCPDCAQTFHKWQHVRFFNHTSLENFLKQGGFKYCHAFVVNFSCRLGFVAALEQQKFPEFCFSAPKSYEEALNSSWRQLHRTEQTLQATQQKLIEIEQAFTAVSQQKTALEDELRLLRNLNSVNIQSD